MTKCIRCGREETKPTHSDSGWTYVFTLNANFGVEGQRQSISKYICPTCQKPWTQVKYTEFEHI